MHEPENDPRFVLLRHEPFPDSDGPSTAPIVPHFDFMLESDGRCLTWALEEWPQASRAVRARRLPDHRIVYLNYEGPIGGDRGSVRRVLSGTYRWLYRSSFEFRLELATEDLRLEVGITWPDADDGTGVFALLGPQAPSAG